MRRRPARPAFVGRRLASFHGGHYFGVGLLWIVFFSLPLATGFVLNRLFDQLSSSPVDQSRALLLCAALVGVEAGRGGLLWFMMGRWAHWWEGTHALLQTNVLRSLVGQMDNGRAPGPANDRLPGSPGEAVSRCRDDVDDLSLMTDNWIDATGATVFAVIAFGVMLGIDPLIALVLIVPLALVLAAARLAGPVLQRWHHEARDRGARVTAFVGEVFANVSTVKSRGAGPAVTGRLRVLNRERRDAAVRNRMGQELMNTFTGSTGEVSIGLVLLLAAPALSRGDFTVGQFALFNTYVLWMTIFPLTLGEAFYRHRQGAVATERLTRLMVDHQDDRDLARHRPVWVTGTDANGSNGSQRSEAATELDDAPFRRLEATGLTVIHADGTGSTGSTNGTMALNQVDLRVDRGSFTVITGAVGSGKTTLLRALLGLVAVDEGTIRWNGGPVPHPEVFMVPPRVAYVGQVPRLFSETLDANLRLGRAASSDEVADALRLAAFDRDVATMPEGLDTVIGSRGARLSGGQIQRATAARALLRRPEVLMVDDLSSALDVETERLLWERLTAASQDGSGPSTLLVVSHRPTVLERADQVVVMDRGRVVAAGDPADVLATSAELRRLWVTPALP